MLSIKRPAPVSSVASVCWTRFTIDSKEPRDSRNGESRRGATRSVDSGMSVEDFKRWLKSFDADQDGRISKDELQKAMRSMRVRFCTMKSGRGVRLADSDGDGYIDDNEMENLVEFAKASMGLKIAT
ncbi:hypothetical protein J5N97_016918 [Dioscorea zingiberensis]|uniref:EF-hand domain-containing protein n=1 Tax=Dioscorea zingiberensis TaxID=325984 RepID=A0A9D5CKC3_9LILI|nr:hypothetical protein J5N97_016918 [Dioscorea zingiberensis]